eukprot:gnl/TRDRNA2_/TRDRNA2_126626_c1_seq1.p1 gnl/TRDRNA2_/TRDRNA2_126626_c1~~gnl/TRDRNA2_/TRDRNA2_126626_c1_seq1.p1  ORF type:complete len:1189 (-),score=212.57 gnl/TRDRNA2_/TRDRNA2_126626_c1_seq1:62-3166(-)
MLGFEKSDLRFVLEIWHVSVQDEKWQAASTAINRLCDRHRQHMHKSLQQIFSKDDSLLLISSYLGWKIDVRDKKSHVVVDQTLQIWGNADLLLLQHSVLQVWFDIVLKESHSKHTKRLCEKRRLDVRKLCCLVTCSEDASCTQMIFWCWKEHINKVKMVQTSTALSDFWREDRDFLLLQTVLHTWMFEVSEVHALDASASRQAEQGIIKNAHEVTMKFMARKANEQSDAALEQLLLSTWHQFVADEWRQRKNARHWKDCKIMEKTQEVWSITDQASSIHVMVCAWSHHTLSARRKLCQTMISESSAEADRLRKLRVDTVRKLSLQRASQGENGFLLATYTCWKDFVNDTKHKHSREPGVKMIRASPSGDRDASMHRALVKFFHADGLLLLQVVVHVWVDVVAREADIDLRAASQERDDHIRDHYCFRSEFFLARAAMSASKLDVFLLFAKWKSLIHEIRASEQRSAEMDKNRTSEEAWMEQVLRKQLQKSQLQLRRTGALAAQHRATWVAQLAVQTDREFVSVVLSRWKALSGLNTSSKRSNHQQGEKSFSNHLTPGAEEREGDNLHLRQRHDKHVHYLANLVAFGHRSSTLYILHSAWATQVKKTKLKMQRRDSRQQCADMMECIVARWDRRDAKSLLRMVMRSWQAYYAAKSLQTFKDDLAQQRARAKPDTISMGMLLDIGSREQRVAKASAIIRIWHFAASSAKTSAGRDKEHEQVLVKKLQNAREDHSQSMLRWLYRGIDVDAYRIIRACVTVWNLAAKETIRFEELSSKTDVDAKRRQIMIEKSLQSGVTISLFAAMRVWREVLHRKLKERQVQLLSGASDAKSYVKEAMRKTYYQMDVLVKAIFLQTWHNLTLEAQASDHVGRLDQTSKSLQSQMTTQLLAYQRHTEEAHIESAKIKESSEQLQQQCKLQASQIDFLEREVNMLLEHMGGQKFRVQADSRKNTKSPQASPVGSPLTTPRQTLKELEDGASQQIDVTVTPPDSARAHRVTPPASALTSALRSSTSKPSVEKGVTFDPEVDVQSPPAPRY